MSNSFDPPQAKGLLKDWNNIPARNSLVADAQSSIEILHLQNKYQLQSLAAIELETPWSFALYQDWLDRGHSAKMEYLHSQAEAKKTPQTLLGKAQTALVATVSYLGPHSAVVHPYKDQAFPSQKGLFQQTARYARGQDYHFWFRSRLEEMAKELMIQYPEAQFRCFTDSAPVLERDLGARAGVGWIGKNSCLISRQHGSFFLLGEIYTSLPLSTWQSQSRWIASDHCGTCNKCIQACPTQAIVENRQVDANRCLSFWNIESREVPPPEIREHFGGVFFGCDICQDICPWNTKPLALNEESADLNSKELLQSRTLHTSELVSSVEETRGRAPPTTGEVTPELVAELRWLLNASGKEIERRYSGTPLLRAGSFGLRRNAILLVANLDIFSLSSEVSRWTTHQKLSELANWCLQKLNKNSAPS